MIVPWPFAQWGLDIMGPFYSQLGIRNHYSLPAHSQANGQVEVTNQSLFKIIKTQLEGAKVIWPEELSNVLWAYRTIVRTPTGETPFRLAYGSEAVIPAEVGLTSYRVDNHDEGRNDEAMHLQLNLLDKVMTTAEQRLACYQDLMAKHYNSRVRHRDFQVGYLVLWKVMGAARDPTQRKVGPNWEGLYRITSWQRKDTYHLEMLDGRKLHHPWNTEHLRKYYQQMIVWKATSIRFPVYFLVSFCYIFQFFSSLFRQFIFFYNDF